MESLPKPFVQGLEGDLRALCADSKRRIPSVKETAERVILLLKEANSVETEAAAADGAAAAFCAACQPPDGISASAANAASSKVVIRAVSCLHKLLTHRALTTDRLPDVIDALERVCTSWSDDSISLKVLQALLSLLTIGKYILGLTLAHLAQAFSLLFNLKSQRSLSAAAAVGPLSVITSGASRMDSEEGVIEVTAKAAFRQVSSDLFGVACENLGTQESREMHPYAVPTSNANATENVSVETPLCNVLQSSPVISAAHHLFRDLCLLLSGSDPRWLDLERNGSFYPISTALAAEVLNDGIRRNLNLFNSTLSPAEGDTSFRSLLSSHLCPVLLDLIASCHDRATLKAVFGLLVTLTQSLWNENFEIVASIFSRLLQVLDSAKQSELTWSSLFGMEAIHELFRHGVAEMKSADSVECDASKDDMLRSRITPTLVSLFSKLETHPESQECKISDFLRYVTSSAQRVCSSTNFDFEGLRIDPLRKQWKPFSTPTVQVSCAFISSAIGFCLTLCSSLRWSSVNDRFDFVSCALESDIFSNILLFYDELAEKAHANGSHNRLFSPHDSAIWPIHQDIDSPCNILEYVMRGYLDLLFAADRARSNNARRNVLLRVAAHAKTALVRHLSTPTGDVPLIENRVIVHYRILFESVHICGERFESQWREVVEALHLLDNALFFGHRSKPENRNPNSADQGSHSSPSFQKVSALKLELEDLYLFFASLPWNSCNALMSALVACSRSAITNLSNGTVTESVGLSGQTTGLSDSDVRIFGVVRGEGLIASICVQLKQEKGPMPEGFWKLFTGHLVTVACDTEAAVLRKSAMKSLVRVILGAIGAEESRLISQDVAISPMIDTLSSLYSDTKQGCLDAVHTILESRGEFMKESAAWTTLLRILRYASGNENCLSKIHQSNGNRQYEALCKDSANSKHETTIPSSGSKHFADDGGLEPQQQPNPPGFETLVLRGFRAVQLIADDFISFLAFEALSDWVCVVGGYALQEQDVNVALTSVGLLWRTADFVAKVSEEECNSERCDSLWMHLFSVLKAIGGDWRPEVRNGAVKTLTSTVTAHGSRLSAEAWKGCIEQALLPLLEDVLKGGVVDAGSGPSSGLRSRADANLVLHYSRDTPRKQWNETRVLALNGVSNVLRMAMPRFSRLTDSNGHPLLKLLVEGQGDGLWAKVLCAACVAASSKESEVAIAGVSAMLELLKASGSILPTAASLRSENPSTSIMEELSNFASEKEDLTRNDSNPSRLHASTNLGDYGSIGHRSSDTANDSQEELITSRSQGAKEMWEAVWLALDSTVHRTVRGESNGISNTDALILLATGLGATRRDFGEKFTTTSSVAFLNIITGLLTGFSSTETSDTLPDSDTIGRIDALEVQRRVVDVMEMVSFGDDTETWMALVDQVLEIISNLRRLQNKSKGEFLLFRLVRLLESLIVENRMPQEVLAKRIDSIITSVGELMCQIRGESIESCRNNSFKCRQNTFHPPGVSADSRLHQHRDNHHIVNGSPDKDGLIGGEEFGENIWGLVSNSFVRILQCGLSCENPSTELWTSFYSVSWKFLFDRDLEPHQSIFDVQLNNEFSLFEAQDVRIAKCVYKTLRSLQENVDDDIASKLIDILVRGGLEGDQLSRPKFAWACQNCLFALADCRWEGMETDRKIRKTISKQAAMHVIHISDVVLQRFIIDTQRAGKCPLPAVRRAETVSLLIRLRELRFEDEGNGAQYHLRTLHSRLCECADTPDDAVRTFAQNAIGGAAG